jgi:hypothetical protein
MSSHRLASAQAKDCIKSTPNEMDTSFAFDKFDRFSLYSGTH